MDGRVQWGDVGVVRCDNGGKEVGDAGRCQGMRHVTLRDAKEWKDMVDLSFFPLSLVCR